MAFRLPLQYRGVLGSIGFFNPQSRHRPRYFTSRAHSLRIWVGMALGWKEWVDKELSDTSFMGLLQQVGVLKAVVSSHYLSNYRDLFNLRHLVRQWCTTTHTFFFSCGEIIVTLEDVANQLLLPILGDVVPGALELSS